MIWTHFKQLSLLAFLAIFTLLLYRRALKRKPVGTKPVNTKTFRIRGVPVDWDDERLESFLTEHCSPSIPKVKSLADQANDGCRDGTVMFQSADPPKRILLPKSSRGPSSPDRWLTLDQDFFGVTALYTPPAKDHILDVIAIAGLGGHAFGSFKEKNGHHMWLRDSLPYDLTHGDAGRPMARIMTYGYESSLAQSKNMQNLEDLAASFRDGLLALARSPTPKPIILIAHSLGGLIVKQALITLSQSKTEEHERLIRAVYGIVFFGVPHDGMDIGSLRAMVGDYSNRFLVESLNRINSQTLNALRRGFHTALGKDGDSEIFCFYETLDSPTVRQNRHGKWAMTGPGTILVAQTSATHCRDWEDGSQHVCAIARSHSDLVKFGPQDNEYDKVREKLRALARRAIKPHRLGRYYYVPLETVETYIQRDELWQELVEKMQLRNENASVPHATAIIGLGGTGKSQLALRYAEQHRDRFNPILWIDATDEEAVRLSFEKCAAKLGLSVDRTTGQASAVADAAAVQTVLQWLENREDTNDQWLVITDNADDFDWGVQKIVPKGKRGNIIITSRDNLAPRLVSGCCEVQVGLMSPQEGRELLLHYLKGDVQPDAVEVRELCDEVVQRLGHLALAIGLAGAHISTYNERVPEKCLRQYLTDYDRHRDQLLRMNRLSGLSATKATIWTVWDTTLEKIEKEYESFKPILLLSFLAQFKGAIVQDELFRLAACGSSGKIPDELQQFLELEIGGWDSFLYRESRDVLLRYNLIQRAEGDWPGSTMHQLVQWRARQSHLHRPWPYWYMAFISAACRQVIEERHRPEFRRHLIAHIPEITQDYLEEWGGTFGTFYLDEGRWEDAENIYVQVLEIRKAKLGADHPDTLTSMGNLASTYWNQGRWEDAEGLEVQVLEISKEKFGVDDPDTLTSMGNLALTYWNQGRWQDAEGLEVQVLDISKEKLGADHPDTLRSMGNLASTYRDQGRWEDAEELQVQVLEIRKAKLGADHPDTLTSMGNLAITYWNQGRWQDAEGLQVQVLEIRKARLGVDHPDTLTSMGNLAITYWDQGRWEDAEGLEVQVLEIRKARLGADHPDTLTSMSNLASTYWNQGRWEDAEGLEVQVLDIRKARLGVDHPDTLTSMSNLALTYRDQGRLEDAEGLQAQVLKLRKAKLGADHPATLTSMNNLAFTWESQGRHAEAVSLMERCLQLRQKSLGPSHPKTESTLSALNRWKAKLEAD